MEELAVGQAREGRGAARRAEGVEVMASGAGESTAAGTKLDNLWHA